MIMLKYNQLPSCDQLYYGHLSIKDYPKIIVICGRKIRLRVC